MILKETARRLPIGAASGLFHLLLLFLLFQLRSWEEPPVRSVRARFDEDPVAAFIPAKNIWSSG